jgi:PTH1 family peptidyl-tRNA hydrolase
VAIEQQSRLLIAGLGNPGKKYAGTRHNLGFRIVEALAAQWGCTLAEKRAFLGKCAKQQVNERGSNEETGKNEEGGKEIHLLLPQTYMNESGWAIKKYMDYYRLNPDQLLVVCDDIALPFGQLRLRRQGSAGGHNGLKSAIAHLGTEQFARLRMGVGAPPAGQPLADYVLEDFNMEEQASLDAFIKEGKQLIINVVDLQAGREKSKV